MRFSRLVRRSQLAKGQMDIAPLVDVCFLLLIFFMLTSNFVIQPGIKVRLPRAVTSEVIDSENLVIVITGQDLLFLNEKPVQIGELVERLKTAARERSNLLIRADVGASLGRVVEIWDLCRELGIAQVNLATNQRRASY
jgi:biopolymer transport protein ExbD